MKLYTKRHIFLVIFLTSLIYILIVGGYLFFSYKNDSSEKENTSEQVASKETSESSISPPMILTEPFSIEDKDYVLELPAWYSSEDNLNYTQDELQNINVYEQCQEAVVNINTAVMGVNWFLEPVPQEGGSGSGSIINSAGYVVTNVHVIEGAYKIYISLSDGTQYEGKVIGIDEASDIAVIKFDPPTGVHLKTISFGNSDNLKVGQKVLAIGNPFAFERTLTTGIVSGLGRPIKNSNNVIIRNMIQTDTAINPGNSGGPLLDTQGRMIGINTMIYSTSGSSAGIGFAVPINTAKRVVSDLIQYGKVRRGAIDGTLVQLTSSIANYAKLRVSQGLLVSDLADDSLALKAGLKPGTEAVQYGSRFNSTTIFLGGDVIIGVDGTQVTSLADYYSLLESKKPGDTVTLTIVRNNKEMNLKITLDEA